jgi:hypothetical protein
MCSKCCHCCLRSDWTKSLNHICSFSHYCLLLCYGTEQVIIIINFIYMSKYLAVQLIGDTSVLYMLMYVMVHELQSGIYLKYLCVFIAGNIPPLVRLLQAYIQKGSKLIIANNNLVRYLIHNLSTIPLHSSFEFCVSSMWFTSIVRSKIFIITSEVLWNFKVFVLLWFWILYFAIVVCESFFGLT